MCVYALFAFGWQIGENLSQLISRNGIIFEWQLISPRSIEFFLLADVRHHLWSDLAERRPLYGPLQGWPLLQPLYQMLNAKGNGFWQAKENGVLRLLGSGGV